MLFEQHTLNRGFMTELKNHFTDSIFYELELTAKYCKMLGGQIFAQYNVDIIPDEYAILDTLSCNPSLCQRDLARLIIKDRANTGKLLDSLEKKGLITRVLAVKNNRPVKMVSLTDDGLKKANEVSDLLRPHMEKVRAKIRQSDLEKIKGLLREFREVLNETVEVNI